MANVVVWSDIPVTDMQRAIGFYQHATGQNVSLMPGTNDTVAVIGDPSDPGAVSADLYLGGTPSHDGSTLYLGSGGDIDAMVARVVEAGGKVLRDKQNMGDTVGWIAFVEDTEGNKLGIQQPTM